MIDKEVIQRQKTNIERAVFGLRTKLNEFTYNDTVGFVKPNKLYSIYYSLNKGVIFMTGLKNSTNSRIISRVKNKSLFQIYTELKPSTRSFYPKPQMAKPSKGDYKIGSIDRYFAKKANDITDVGFEISKESFDRPRELYETVTIKWKISGKKLEVLTTNLKNLKALESSFLTLSKNIPPLQLWKPIKDSAEDVQKKLLLLKID
tara:strand:- start:43 stop:654 length:612 start_codon:yes stop_codon:yes gene_type:complete